MTKFRNREGLQAVNAENRTFEALQGNYVDNGVEVSTDGTDMTLDVDSGTVVQSNEEHGIGATTVTVPDNNEDNPRKDIVYVDGTQSVEVATGAAAAPSPALENVDNVFDTAEPSPPSLVNSDDVVVLAEVWVESGATEITSEDLEDRRLTLGLETGSGTRTDFSLNQSVIEILDADSLYLHGPMNFIGETVEISVTALNISNIDGEIPEGVSIQLFDVAGASESFEDQDPYILAEWDSNFEKGDPVDTININDKIVVFRLANDTGKTEKLGGFVSGDVNE